MLTRTLLLALWASLCWSDSALAQSSDKLEQSPQGVSSKKGEKATEPASDQEAEKLVLEFVQQHQPELARLMAFLKSNRPTDYQQALKENRKIRERLAGLKQRDPELHDVELELWKNAAQLRLLAASVSASGQKLNDENRQQLNQLIVQENELTVKRLKLEKARAEARLSQITQQLQRRLAQSEATVTKGLKSWENRIERSSKPKKD